MITVIFDVISPIQKVMRNFKSVYKVLSVSVINFRFYKFSRTESFQDLS